MTKVIVTFRNFANAPNKNEIDFKEEETSAKFERSDSEHSSFSFPRRKNVYQPYLWKTPEFIYVTTIIVKRTDKTASYLP